MIKFFTVLLILLLSQAAYSAGILPYSDETPEVELIVRESISGPVIATLFASVEPPNANLYEASEIYLRIDDKNESWWIHTPEPFDSMDIVQFLQASHLLITVSTPASISTAALDLDDKSLYLIGSGSPEVISSNPDDPLVQLTGQRGYSEGVFWYSSITDLQGRVIEFLPGGETCILISEIVSEEDDLSRLQQPVDYCVGVTK